MEWLQNNLPELIVVIVITILFFIYVFYFIKKEGLRKVAIIAILEAEKLYNSTTGKERLSYAVDYVYEYLPSYVKLLFPKNVLKEDLEHFIQAVFDQVKDLLDYEKGVDLDGEIKETKE